MSDLNFIASRLPGAPGAISAVAITGTVPDPPRNFASLDNGTILRGTVQGRDQDGLIAIKTDQGVLKVATNANLQAGSNVTLEVRSVGDRLQVVVLAIDHPAASPASPAAATEAAAQNARPAPTEDRHDAQGTGNRAAALIDNVARSASAIRQAAEPPPAVIVAGARLTAIVIQAVPRELIQSSTATLQQRGVAPQELSLQPAPDAGKPAGRAAFTADFRPLPPPPISASLLPQIHDRLAALFTEPAEEPAATPQPPSPASGSPPLSPDIRERIVALFVGAPTGTGATPPVSAPGQPAPAAAGQSPATQVVTPPADGATAAAGQPAPPAATPPTIAPAVPQPQRQPDTPPRPGVPLPGAAAGAALPPELPVTNAPAIAAEPRNAGPSNAGLAPTAVPPPPASPAAEQPPAPTATTGAPQLPQRPGGQPGITAQPHATTPPPPAAVLASGQPPRPAGQPTGNPAPLSAPRQPAQPESPPHAAAAPAQAAQAATSTVAGDEPPAAQQSPPTAQGTGIPTRPAPVIVPGDLADPPVQPSVPPSSAPPPQPSTGNVLTRSSISPEILAQLIADAGNAGSGGAPLQPVAVSPTQAEPPPQQVAPTPPSLAAAALALLQSGSNGMPSVAAEAPGQPAQLFPGNLPLSPSVPNSAPQDPAVSPSPITPFPVTPLPAGTTTTADGNSAGQAASKAGITGNPAVAAPAEATVADGAIDPKAGSTTLTAVVSATGKVSLENVLPAGTTPVASGAGTGGAGTVGAASGGARSGGAVTGNAAPIGTMSDIAGETVSGPGKMADGLAGAIIPDGKGLVPAALPTGTEVRLRVLGIQQPGAFTGIGAAQISAAAAGKTTVIGQILGHTPAGHPVIHTALGDLVLQQQATLPVGADITLALEAVDVGAAAGSLVLPATPQLMALNLAQGWPTLLDLLMTLQHALPGDTAAGSDAGTMARLAQPGSKLAADMAEAVDAFRTGDFEKMFGSLATALKTTGSKQDSVRKLRDEFVQLSGLTQDQARQDWRCVFLPLWDDGRLQQINLFYRRPRRGQAKDDGEDATRFVVDVTFSKLGGCQLDGLIRKKHFDLMIRSHQELPLTIKRDIAGLFAEARELGNYAGDVSFQTSARFPVSPLEEIVKDAPSVTA